MRKNHELCLEMIDYDHSHIYQICHLWIMIYIFVEMRSFLQMKWKNISQTDGQFFKWLDLFCNRPANELQ
jgi:hypothetical protein